MDRFDPFVKYADVYGDIINWEKDPMNKPQNQNKYFFSDGKTYYEQICKMLRLMSFFKEAFNQIYSNEDEISEAWENFVNNLSASVVEGSEPDVTLTWTDDSVNFEFTMVPGVPGEQGVGITSISFNSDYTMTITLSDGNTYTSMSLKGETGPQGPQGETGGGLQILDVYATLADLQSAHPTGQPGDAYQVGSAGNYTLYIWSSSQSAWVQAGTLGTVSPYTSVPLMDGTASAGSQNLYARGDHVHPSDTSRASKEELDALIKTSQSLIDQSFTYRESPAIQDGLARIDKIKGNTLVWNQKSPVPSTQSKTENDVTFTNNNDGTIIVSTVSSGATGRATFSCPEAVNVKNHILFINGLPSSASSTTIYYQEGYSGTNIGVNKLFTPTTNKINLIIVVPSGSVITQSVVVSPQIFDLTLMFGEGNEPTSVDDFTKLFPLPYYAYESGKLLSFNGTGMKTANAHATEEHTVNLPTLTYFPDGMRSAGSVYDELTEKKAIKRVNEYTLSGSDISTGSAESANFYRITLASSIIEPNNAYKKGSCNRYTLKESYSEIANNDKSMGFNASGNTLLLHDNSLSDIQAVINSLNANPIVFTYPLLSEEETDVELDLSYNTYEGGTEQLLPVNGSVPSTSPIIADMTYMSIDDAMEYIIEKLANVPQNTQQILDSLEDDVADLQTDVGALQPAVSALQTSVGNINTNIGQLSSTVAGHTSSISSMQSDITDLNTHLGDLSDTVTDHTSRIGTLETGLSATNGNVQSLSSQVQSIDGRVTNLETDLLKIVKKEYDYDSVAGNTNFGVQTGLSQEPGYKIIGIVGSEVQQGEYTSAEPRIIVTQAHVHYNSTGTVILSMEARNVSEYKITNVRVYLYLLCIKDTQSQ